MMQTDTRRISYRAIIRSADFRAGLSDARAGRSARFEEFQGWLYEWGRQAAHVIPMRLPITHPDTLDYLARAFERGDLPNKE
jgi:hypothetical protein